MNLLHNSQIIATTKTCVGLKSTIFGPAVDMRDCAGVLFIVTGSTGWAAVGDSGYLHAQMSSSTGGNWVNMGSTVATKSTGGGTTGSHRAWLLDFNSPITRAGTGVQKRYARAVVNHSTDETIIIGLKYGLTHPGATHYRDNPNTPASLLIASTA